MSGDGQTVVHLNDGRWLVLGDEGLRDDAATGREISRLVVALGGDSVREFIGRTPIIAGADSRHALIARVGDASPRPAPGVVRDVLRLGDTELWRYKVDDRDRLALVNRAGEIRPIPPLDLLVTLDLQLPSRRFCAEPHAEAIAPAPHGVAALITECSPEAPTRVQAFRMDGASEVRRFAPLATTGLALDDLEFAMSPNGLPVVAGLLDGRLAIARGDKSGGWSVTATTIRAVTFAADTMVDSSGAVWTNTLGAGADGKDEYSLERDGRLVTLRDPDGLQLETHDFKIDKRLGAVVLAWARHSPEAPYWLLAERPPSGALRDIR